MAKKLERYEVQGIENLILTVRSQKVILDADLARIFGISTKRLNEHETSNGFPLTWAQGLSSVQEKIA